jgi:hypothetical protein
VLQPHALLRSADDDRLDQRLIAEFQQQLVGDVRGLLSVEQGCGQKIEGLGQPAAEILGKIGHLVPGARPLLVDPVEDLAGAERGLAALAQTLAEGLEGLSGERGEGGNEPHGIRSIVERCFRV